MPLPVVLSNILSPLTNIFGIDILLPVKSFANLEETKGISWLPDILLGNNIIDQLGDSRQSYIKSKIIKCIDYKNLKRLDKAILVFQFHNVFRLLCSTFSFGISKFFFTKI